MLWGARKQLHPSRPCLSEQLQPWTVAAAPLEFGAYYMKRQRVWVISAEMASPMNSLRTTGHTAFPVGAAGARIASRHLGALARTRVGFSQAKHLQPLLHTIPLRLDRQRWTPEYFLQKCLNFLPQHMPIDSGQQPWNQSATGPRGSQARQTAIVQAAGLHWMALSLWTRFSHLSCTG